MMRYDLLDQLERKMDKENIRRSELVWWVVKTERKG